MSPLDEPVSSVPEKVQAASAVVCYTIFIELLGYLTMTMLNATA